MDLHACHIFGKLLLIYRKKCRRNTQITGLANSFSCGIFLGIAVFHLLPEAAEKFESYFKEQKIVGIVVKLPLAPMIAFFAYSLILFIEKIAFDSHALISHDHSDDNEKELESKNAHDFSDDKSNDHMINNQIQKLSKEEKEEEEEDIKRLVTAKGKFGSFISSQAISKIIFKNR